MQQPSPRLPAAGRRLPIVGGPEPRGLSPPDLLADNQLGSAAVPGAAQEIGARGQMSDVIRARPQLVDQTPLDVVHQDCLRKTGHRADVHV